MSDPGDLEGVWMNLGSQILQNPSSEPWTLDTNVCSEFHYVGLGQ
jgi:hypothetical protein